MISGHMGLHKAGLGKILGDSVIDQKTLNDDFSHGGKGSVSVRLQAST